MTIKRRNYGRGHGYTIDGKKAIGVTTAIKNGLPNSALMYWSARRVAEYVADTDPAGLELLRRLGRDQMVTTLKGVPWAERDAAAGRGTEVHTIAEKLITGERVPVPDELAGHVRSCVHFMNEWKPRPLLVEKVVGSYQWGYAGTFDLIAELPDGKRVLFDYKTSGSGIWPETALQLAAYRYADAYVADDQGTEIPMSEVGIDWCAAVWVRADGYDVIPLMCGEAQFKFFLHSLWIARNAEDMSGWVGEAIRP